MATYYNANGKKIKFTPAGFVDPDTKKIYNTDQLNKAFASGEITGDQSAKKWQEENNEYLLSSNYNPYTSGDLYNIDNAKEAADIIMRDYREFGEGNEYLNKEYGADNPYMQSALSNILELENMAKSTDMTKYAKAMLDEQNLLKANQEQDLVQGMSSDLSTARSNLAMSGGINTGARERLAQAGVQTGMMNRQKLGAEDALARRGIMSRDASYKQNLLSQIPGLYNPYAMGKESWNQNRGLAREQYEQEKEKLRYGTIGNIYGQERA